MENHYYKSITPSQLIVKLKIITGFIPKNAINCPIFSLFLNKLYDGKIPRHIVILRGLKYNLHFDLILRIGGFYSWPASKIL